MRVHKVADELERYVRETFQIAADDPGFGRMVDLFEAGYVDSVGVIELLAFVTDAFAVEVPDSALLSDNFATINGMAAIIVDLVETSNGNSPVSPVLSMQGDLVAAMEPER